MSAPPRPFLLTVTNIGDPLAVSYVAMAYIEHLEARIKWLEDWLETAEGRIADLEDELEAVE